MLLIHITIVGVLDMDQMLNIIGAIPSQPECSGWTCWSWVWEGIAALDADVEVLETREMDWDTS